MTVSVCVVARDEERALPALLRDIRMQDYPHARMEVVLIDSMSTDRTRELMLEFQRAEHDFWQVQVLTNSRGNQASGWNEAIAHFRGDVLIRVDAHASIPADFVSKNMELIGQGEDVTGGPRPNIIEEDTPWKRTLLLAEQSMFGSSVASYRRSQEKAYVKSLFHGAYRREVIEKVGGFNEQLGRTEDNEFHYRIRKAGYRICYSPEIVSYQHTRSTLRGMLKQKFGNGYWVALTTKVCPGCLSVFHFVPLAFVLGILVTSFLAWLKKPALAVAMWSLYGVTALSMSIVSVRNEKKCLQQLALPFLFLALHVSYGVGSLVGLFKLPFWQYKNTLEENR